MKGGDETLSPEAISAQLDANGWADLGCLISQEETGALKALYPQSKPFRSHIHMRHHGFGEGEYKYFAYPLPPLIKRLRGALYPALASIANQWQERIGSEHRYPASHDRFLEKCHAAGQTRPTPLILKYGEGDYNCLHQDIYGETVFPLQIVVLLSGENDFAGGEFVLTEQRPRMQSRAEVVPLRTGHGVVFPVNERPKQNARGRFYRVKQRHGVSTIRGGERFTLGIIFHDAA